MMSRTRTRMIRRSGEDGDFDGEEKEGEERQEEEEDEEEGHGYKVCGLICQVIQFAVFSNEVLGRGQ